MKDLAEVLEDMECVKEIEKKILERFKAELSMKGLEGMDAEEASDVVDMIKDLAETKKDCLEALYYQKVVEAMVSYDEVRYGYIPNSPKSKSRTSSTGTSRTKFMPHTSHMEYGDDMDGEDYMREAMGDGRGRVDDPRYGKAYNEYRMTRRHYTTSKSPEDKHEMNVHAEEHLRDSISTIRDIWEDADPALKKRMKEDFTKLVNEMVV